MRIELMAVYPMSRVAAHIDSIDDRPRARFYQDDRKTAGDQAPSVRQCSYRPSRMKCPRMTS